MLGLVLVGDPSLAIDIIGVLGGVLLAYFGTGEVLSAVGAPPEQERPSLSRDRVGLTAIAVSLGVLIGGPALALGLRGHSVSRPPVAKTLTCNGYAQLCSRRIDQVVFPGTHNSMSAADSPGWFIANQSHGIARQLDDGLRAFKVSTHYGEGKPGNVRTDIEAEGARANRVSEKLSKEARAALQRFSGSVGFGPRKGKREVWLCHTLCELGATNAVGFFNTIRRFLTLNPGQVIVLFDEDYVRRPRWNRPSRPLACSRIWRSCVRVSRCRPWGSWSALSTTCWYSRRSRSAGAIPGICTASAASSRTRRWGP